MNEVIKLKHVARIRPSNVDKKTLDGEQGVRLCNYTDVYYNDVIRGELEFMSASATPDQVRQFQLCAGDVLITKDSETADDIAIPAFIAEDLPGVLCGYHLSLIRPQRDRIDPKFLFWCMVSSMVRSQAENYAAGITRVGIRSDLVGSLLVPYLPLEAQRAIAHYLDSETSRIDALIAKKRHMIDLQEERYRTALDITVSTLDWPLAPLGRFVTRISQGDSPRAANRPAEPGEWGVLKLSAVKYGRFIPSENKAMADDAVIDRELMPTVGDLLVTRSNTPQYVGDVAAVTEAPGQVLLCDLIYRLKLDSRLHASFAAAALLTARSRYQLSSSARGTSQSMVKLRGEDIKAIRIPLAPWAEQVRVVDALEKRRSLHATTRASLEHQIELLIEHRQALITAAVTGDLDIPGVAA